MRAELLVGAAGAAVGAGGAALSDPRLGTVAAAAVLGGALGGYRRSPRAAWLTAATAVLVLAALVPAGRHELPLVTFLLAGIHAFCAGRYDARWTGRGGLVLVAATCLAAAGVGDSVVPSMLLPGAAWLTGRALREREEVAAQLAGRARELEEEREAHALLSVRYERARIASELHDIVAHAISVMVVQASAGQRLAAHDPRLTAETFATIAGAAREAEQDLGRLVALLGDESAIGPAPDLAMVEELVTRASGSGLAVNLRLDGRREELPPQLAQTAYRVVQEGLTNALRYAAGAPVFVLVRGECEGVLVVVENGPASRHDALTGTGTGRGLMGLRERVGECAGTLEAGPTSAGGWRLAAHLGCSRLIPEGEPAAQAHPAG